MGHRPVLERGHLSCQSLPLCSGPSATLHQGTPFELSPQRLPASAPTHAYFKACSRSLGVPQLSQGPSEPPAPTWKPGWEAGAETPPSAATGRSIRCQALSFIVLNLSTLSASPFCTIPAAARATCLSLLVVYSSLSTLPTSNLKPFQQTKDFVKTRLCLNLSIAPYGPWE